ncbi:acyl carrier protein [Vibrio ruber DSM 16370]|uniref:Acyl carrier protein n=1 Tax=Vibrio ruber (strain DSM 16370 / JCM 11486 / BCRC 17186 / CECT 7878 / LMG 23124 / VR1) TaxID=1123498 RepID=A0A1R4LNW8_VIBR1|nr:acyl carrier protein [Vibrio ruber]SJN58089.1 acyl carrier protein [Vibrio ruber DSM 16370]
MEKEKIRNFVISLLKKNGEKNDVNISDDDSLIESNRFDSLDIAELTLFLEDEYNIYISSSDADSFKQIDTINLINKYITMNK